MKKHIYFFIMTILAFFSVSCGNDEKKLMADTTVIPVKVSSINENNNSPFLTASGSIQAVNSANLSTRMMGYVTNIPVNVGDKVKKGQLLVAINNSDLQAKRSQVNAGIMEATAAFTNAEKDYNRFKNLFADASASQKEFDDITANYNMAKARLEGAKQMKNEVEAQFAYVNIRAPFDGVVTGKFIKNGDMANPGMPLVAMEMPAGFEVMASVPESEISKITLGATVTVLIKSINKEVKGKLTEVSSSAKNTGGQYMVKVALDKTDVPVLSGMFVTVQFPVEAQEKTDMVLIPEEAIVSNGQLSGIYTVSESNTALLRWLRLGRTFGNQVEVLSGLSSNETFIISADGKLYNGVKISIQ
jgi:RND family efflux transporter MFP subunit